MAPITPWWRELELKILPHLALSIESEIMDGFWCSRCPNNRINFPNIRSFASGATASLVAKKGTKILSQLFEELQGSNLEILIVVTPMVFMLSYADKWDFYWHPLCLFYLLLVSCDYYFLWDYVSIFCHSVGWLIGLISIILLNAVAFQLILVFALEYMMF